MRIYFLGIGGSAMGNVAILLKKQGYSVMGSDGELYPPMSQILEAEDTECYSGFDPERLKALKPDLVVVGNAISRGNSELEWLLNSRAIPTVSLPQLIREHLLLEKESLVIAGTHGKTTTASIAAFLLGKNKADPSWLIGGVSRTLSSGAHFGSGAHFVIEGDEYDSAFFDKRSKFIHYRPDIVAINNLEMDHADIFRDLVDLQRSFSHLIKLIPQEGFLIVNGEDPNIEAILEFAWCPILRVGTGPENDLIISDFMEAPNGSSFNLSFRGKLWAKIEWSLCGLYNARNAAIAALTTGIALNANSPTQIDLTCLNQFQGVKRRQEKLFENKNHLIFEDFAHHPTAIKETLNSFRAQYPGHKIIACFEPRSNTARTQLFQSEFTDALSVADQVLLGELIDKRSSKVFEEGTLFSSSSRLDRKKMALDLQDRGTGASFFEKNHDLLEFLIDKLESYKGMPTAKVIVFFSNGSFSGIMKKLALVLSSFD